ncbi:hypothetical protein PVAR5_8702 [Paecilomyces variotii No. 5]|uniref:DUF7730 domain-containing protein n=1 Tax=Byssochlamys spectabilis (strain No. 5 / NBRC 109023) TaxID=1356009 RepID=V5GD37_BYSSN|nr:hypothetical protein PVAR5_8702 [Paecilomyces variotii No. 5]
MAEDAEMPDASDNNSHGSHELEPMELDELDESDQAEIDTSQMQSIFFSLPLEIRQKIYSELLSRHKNKERTPNRNWAITQLSAECDCCENGTWDCGRNLQGLINGNYSMILRFAPAWTIKYRLNVQILRTCYRIYEEAREFLYERNQWIDVSFCSNALRQAICLLGIRPVTRHTPLFKQPNKFASTVFKLHICPFNSRCRQSFYSMRTVFLVGPEDLSDLVPSISNYVYSGTELFSKLSMRFYPDNIWPRGARRKFIMSEFQRKVLGVLSRIRMTSRPVPRWPLPEPDKWAVHPLGHIGKTKVEKSFAPRLTTFMPIHEFLAYFLKRMNCYATHRWDPKFEAEEDNVRDLAFQWYNGLLRYRSQIESVSRYRRRAQTISVQLQLRYQIVQLHRGKYCYHTNTLELSLNEGELKGNQLIIQRFWTGAEWCLGDLDLEPSSKEYQLILNIGWLFTWNHIPSWWNEVWEYVNSEHFSRTRARRFLSKHVPRIAKIGDYGSSKGCRDPEGLSKEVENALAQFYIDSEPSSSEAEEEL